MATTTPAPAANLLAAALDYAARGLPVFPLVPGTKRPLTKNGFKDATTDVTQIVKWWSDCPDANIGIPTGLITKRVVVDVDKKPWKNATGDQTLAALVEKFGPLPTTLSQTTWSGGTQYFFAYHAEGVNRAHHYGEFIDSRTDGGYVAVPPSRVTEDGHEGEYKWNSDPFTTPLADMPDWLVERGRSGPFTPGIDKKPGEKKRRNIPGWADALIDGVAEGARDDTAVRLIGRYTQLGLTRAEVESFMLNWAANCTPAFDESLILEKIDRLYTIMDAGLVTLPLTDTGNAERLVLLHGDRFKWAVDRETWLAWDGHRWAEGSEDRVRALALDTVRQTQAAALRVTDEHRKKAVGTFALYSEDRRRIDNAVAMARILPGVAVQDNRLDQHPTRLNVLNGTIDLSAGELRAHDPNDFITQLVYVEYDPAAQAPTWLKFLNDIFLGNAEMIAYVQRAIGYSVTGLIEEQAFFFEHGAGDNGKSTFIETVSGVIGEDYATAVDKEAVLAADKNKGRGATPELMALKGKRLGYISENDADRVLDEGRIKSLTGSKKMPGRELYQSTEAFANTIKVWFDLNTLPKFNGTDNGIARRPRVIPFDFSVPPEKKDKRMPEKLAAEAKGILTWIVEGAVAWNAEGLRAPEAVDYATREYLDEQNHLPVFIRETYETNPNGEVEARALQQDYQNWARERGEEAYDWQKKVVPFLRGTLKLKPKKRNTGNVWPGIARRAAAA
jgi:putative DNA primase/helicase